MVTEESLCEQWSGFHKLLCALIDLIDFILPLKTEKYFQAKALGYRKSSSSTGTHEQKKAYAECEPETQQLKTMSRKLLCGPLQQRLQ